MSVIKGSRIVLGVSGGIAAYKAADLASKLVQAGAVVDVILTPAASRLVGPATFQALTKRPVYSDVFVPWTETWFGHISLGHDAEAIAIAPATANTIAKLAHGLADDMLGAVVLSTRAPLLFAPAMEHDMFQNAATQANLQMLRDRGAVQVGPETGRLASGEIGNGRMVSPETIISAIRLALGRDGPLAGHHVVVTAGGTQEPVDPVRFLGNRSSGRMGHALAQAALDAGARVTLITAASGQPVPFGSETVRVRTSQEMLIATTNAVESADALIMSAAVADFRPRESAGEKIKKTSGNSGLTLELARNTDIIASIDRQGLVKVGFAAETENLFEFASAKLREKHLDMIVANDAESTIGSPDSTAQFLFPDGDPVNLPRLPKEEVAEKVICHVARLCRQRIHG